jgi:NADH-quinone oxidoreductase subunit C
MSSKIEALAARVEERLGDQVARVHPGCNELSYEVPSEVLLDVCHALRDDLGFEMLMDLCAVDYLHYGDTQWETNQASELGFSRAVNRPAEGYDPRTAEGHDRAEYGEALDQEGKRIGKPERRFAIAYQLLSIRHNARLRFKVFCPDDERPMVDSVVDVWNSANWFEREAFDLFGVLFRGHPDLRRILTDYGFIGHPFRKDFPLIGRVEVRYDPEQGRVVYEPVSIQPRTLVPRVIRDDNRYEPQIHDEASFREAGSDA